MLEVIPEKTSDEGHCTNASCELNKQSTSCLLSLGRHLCWWTIGHPGCHLPNSQWLGTGMNCTQKKDEKFILFFTTIHSVIIISKLKCISLGLPVVLLPNTAKLCCFPIFWAYLVIGISDTFHGNAGQLC